MRVSALTHDWIEICIEDSLQDLMGVMEVFGVDEDEGKRVLDETLAWLRSDPIQVTE